MTAHFDVAIVGAGIVGLAHAWMASRRGRRVVVLERSPIARGASVRNFGMIWPIGQVAGELYDVSLRSREFWLQLDSLGVLKAETCGSIHLAHREDELAVLEEFSDQGTHDSSMLTAGEVVKQSSLANPDGLLAGMQSTTELRVDPRIACSQLASWLAEQPEVEIHFETPVVGIDNQTVMAADQRAWKAEQIIVCSGSDLQTLYPEVLASSDLQLCKLQMMKSVAQPMQSGSVPHLASGLTLRHYRSFDSCSSHAALRQRIAEETPELDRYGIHVMASQFEGGEVILGDSHEYGDQITPFDNSEIDELMVRELRKVIRLCDWRIAERWHGIYAKHPELPVFESKTPDGSFVFVGTGGAGMTMSFGLADRAWKRWLGEGEQ